MAKMSVKNDHTKCWLKDEEWEHSYCTGEKLQWWNHAGKSLATSLKKKKKNSYLPYDPATLFPGIYAREKERKGDFYTTIHRNFICNNKKLTIHQIPFNK